MCCHILYQPANTSCHYKPKFSQGGGVWFLTWLFYRVIYLSTLVIVMTNLLVLHSCCCCISSQHPIRDHVSCVL